MHLLFLAFRECSETFVAADKRMEMERRLADAERRAAEAERRATAAEARLKAILREIRTATHWVLARADAVEVQLSREVANKMHDRLSEKRGWTQLEGGAVPAQARASAEKPLLGREGRDSMSSS